MGNDWKELTIDELKAPYKGSIAMGPFGSRIKAENFVKQGIPIIKGGNLHGACVKDSGFDFLTKEKAEELKNSQAFRGDLVITHRGTIGQVSIIPNNSLYEKYIVSQSQLKVSLDTTKINPFFVNYFFKSHLGQHRLLANASQVGVPAIAKASSSVKKILVPCPSLKEQNNIVQILQSLDNKIQLNRQTNQTLEQMAQALFKSWFVDFDPVIDNALAAGNPIPEPFVKRAETRKALVNKTLPEEQRKLFPSEFEETERSNSMANAGGWVPKGWKLCGLGSFIKFENGKTMNRLDEGKYPLYGANGIIGRSNEAKSTNAIIIGRVGAYCGAIEYCPSSFWPSDNTIVASSNTSEEMIPFILYQLKFLNLNQYAGGAAQPLLNQTTLKSIEVSIPEQYVSTLFNTTISSFLERINGLNSEIAKLIAIRDTLLPKLISGELRLPETDSDHKQASDATA